MPVVVGQGKALHEEEERHLPESRTSCDSLVARNDGARDADGNIRSQCACCSPSSRLLDAN